MEKKSKKLPIIIGAVAVIIIAVIVVVMNMGHRVIKVESFQGAVTLERGSNEKDIVDGMNLKSEDTVTTGEDGLVELLVDEDKHIVAQENTCFTITSSGNEKKGKLKIKLEYGTSLVEIDNKLPEGSSVELETPNAALSVRGTTFETSYTGDDNTTVVKVTDGVVSVATGEETAEVEAGKMAIVTDDEIEVVDMPFSHTEEIAFEALYMLSAQQSGVYVKKLVGWETNDFEVENSAWNNGVEYCRLFEKNHEWIRYHVYTKKEVLSSLESRYASCERSDALAIEPQDKHKEGLQYMENEDGDTVICSYVYGQDIDSSSYYYDYYKKISEDMYLKIRVEKRSGGRNEENTLNYIDIYTYLPITTNDYFVFSDSLNVNTDIDSDLLGYDVDIELFDEVVEEEPVEEPTETIQAGTPIAEDELPTLLRGEITYTQLEYLVRMAEEAYAADFDIDNFDKMLDNIWFEPSVEGVYAPIEGTSATYDVAMLNNLLSFYSDEQISESNIPGYCTLSGNELTYSPCTVSKGDNITIAINKIEYGENGEILVEYSFERKHADISLGYYTAGVSVVHLTPDENGKYMFNYIEEISSEQVNYDFNY